MLKRNPIASNLIALPAQPADVPWPDAEWPVGRLDGHVDQDRFDALTGAAFDDPPSGRLGETHALLIVQNGRIVFEKYDAAHDVASSLPSWSEAKSITHALIGILVREGKIDIHKPADVPEWQGEDDPRRAITLDHLLRMSSGLAFKEEYEPDNPSDVIEMLFGSGQKDVAAFAADFPLTHEPGDYWSYASGTTNIIARFAGQIIGGGAQGFHDFMKRELFSPIGMASPIPKFDEAGTFIGSSYCFCTARDFARFGTLYLRDGEWNKRRLLPEGWVDYARTPTPQPDEDDSALGYGAQWWLGIAGPHSFSANGYEGQYTVLVPELDLVLVRHGASEAVKDNVRDWIGEVVDCFRG